MTPNFPLLVRKGNFPKSKRRIVMNKKNRKVSAATIAGAIVRIAIIAFFALIGVGVWAYTVIGFQESTLLGRFWSGMSLASLIFLFGAWIWGFWKWIVFMAPKTFSWANWMWKRLIPLSIVGLAFKAMLWLYILIAPIMLFSAVMFPMALLSTVLTECSDRFYIAIPLFLISSGLCVGEIIWDICKPLGRVRTSRR